MNYTTALPAAPGRYFIRPAGTSHQGKVVTVRPGRQQAGVALFMRGWRASQHIPKVVFEHPVSVISSLFRKPDQIIQPWQFWHLDEPGKGEVKTTCLWTRGVPPLVPTTPDEPGRLQACWLMGPSDTRAEDRSRTYRGIADALALQYAGDLRLIAA